MIELVINIFDPRWILWYFYQPYGFVVSYSAALDITNCLSTATWRSVGCFKGIVLELCHASEFTELTSCWMWLHHLSWNGNDAHTRARTHAHTHTHAHTRTHTHTQSLGSPAGETARLREKETCWDGAQERGRVNCAVLLHHCQVIHFWTKQWSQSKTFKIKPLRKASRRC